MDQVKIGKLIEKCRKQSKLTQQELAEKLFVDRTLISKWENGKLCPDIKYFQELCNIFNIELKELLSGEIKNKENEQVLNNNLFNFFKKLNSKTKLLKFVILTLLIIVFAFLSYYFYETYNKTKVFTLSGESEHFRVNQGLLVLTREKSYFIIDNFASNIDKITIYYNYDNNKNIIYEGNDMNIIIDFSGYNSSINIINYKKIIDNVYIDVTSGDIKETIPISFTENYKNNKLLFRDDNQIDNSLYDNNINKENIFSDCEENICSYKDNDFQLFYDTVINKLTITNNDDINIDYFFDTKYFDYTSEEINFVVENGKITCSNENCFEKEIYNKFYTKYIKPIEKN